MILPTPLRRPTSRKSKIKEIRYRPCPRRPIPPQIPKRISVSKKLTLPALIPKPKPYQNSIHLAPSKLISHPTKQVTALSQRPTPNFTSSQHIAYRHRNSQTCRFHLSPIMISISPAYLNRTTYCTTLACN